MVRAGLALDDEGMTEAPSSRYGSAAEWWTHAHARNRRAKGEEGRWKSE